VYYSETCFFASGILLFASSFCLGDSASACTILARSLESDLGSTGSDDILGEFFVLHDFFVGEMWGEGRAVGHSEIKSKI
jgi:hypothetical protein